MTESIWLKNYPKGVPHTIDPDKYSSLVDLFEESVKTYKDRVAYINMGKSMTFGELDELSKRFASYLQNELNIKKGDRVAIQMPNCLQYPVAMFGVLRAGAIVVNTNPLYTAREMEHQFKDSGVGTVIMIANFASNLEKIIDKTNIKNVIITELGDMLGFLKGNIVNLVVKYVKKMVPDYKLPGAIKFNTTLKADSEGYDRVPVSGNDLAFLQYTGGTTGVSKGAMLTHRNIIANAEQTHGWMKPKLVEGEELMVTALPLYHIFALTVNCILMFKIGASNLLITNPRDMKAYCKELTKYDFTVMTGVNTLFNGMLNHDDFKKIDFSNLKFSVGGGMAVQRSVAERWQKETNSTLIEGYGLTESSPVLNCNPLDGTDKIGTIGLPLPSTLIKIVDDEGNEVPQGDRGELCAYGPQIMKGYWQNEEATENVMVDGWLKTGDIAEMDTDGFFKIVDRKKEMINVSGFNVYPNEVEDAIAAHDKVMEVGAIGVPDEKSTEAVKVYVVKKDESLTEDELHAYCKENLTGYKRPKYVEFTDELPKSNVGKILRRVLRDNDPLVKDNS
ncbi:long-chain-fatty-acid--CoA ligase FadD [Mangrovivirga sp. M17]|uniref:Long-chain-fatty-acid--CoA ligase n=1 Tax=Mangrovivirga halotolerans TaxID=2993936 RepID=A0ABT3RR97_9BACT|nr:long-chain-fatty-acid--CoA ligase FadD [Mangrovivirga halotolerans]MCX2744299.1 long-chain-fatty-acid--CoA ligase FadD [Mangrovivirga halotolerans]